MVSCGRELFRRRPRDETFGGEMRVISMKLKWEDFRRRIVPLASTTLRLRRLLRHARASTFLALLGKKDADGRDIGERKRCRPLDGYARPSRITVKPCRRSARIDI